MTQQAFADGGMVSAPYHHFQRNEQVYQRIQARLDRLDVAYRDATEADRLRALFDSATYALLTARTPLPRADRAFEAYLDVDRLDEETLIEAFQGLGLGLFRLKAEYIADNHADMGPFERADEAILSGDLVDAQDALLDARGLGPAKSAFTLATLGQTATACADGHICRYFDVDPRSYEKHNAGEYKALIEEIFARVPELVDETSTFMAQWVTWDLARADGGSHAPVEQQGTITMHETYFDAIEATLL